MLTMQLFYSLLSTTDSRTFAALKLLRKVIAISNIRTDNGSTKENYRSNISKSRRDDDETRSCLCLLVIDEIKLEAKIVHKGRGKFKILADQHGGKYINKIVDASDIIRCLVA